LTNEPRIDGNPTALGTQRAVFLSYPSEDAQTICTALRSAGIEVWFDQSELRGGCGTDFPGQANVTVKVVAAAAASAPSSSGGGGGGAWGLLELGVLGVLLVRETLRPRRRRLPVPLPVWPVTHGSE
jgi:hypothetical protein